ncbi:Wadjet anti-phage system protein JetD domain-containing protein [Acidocella sp.]|uniref:Wadjet anti-phage system protein JetD domain-containing protein n=1 Tax=Acidocella sp. TaxID=50710 RepID=UPI0026319D5C|nr:Wadjet anti-phage system protein JetD domain-containing protein [Acidocella sp.]
MNWTMPADVRSQIAKLWTQGKLLASLATNTPLFPLRLAFRAPTAAEMVNHFDEVRVWIRDLHALPCCRIETRSFRHRELGNNAVPAEVWIDNFDDAVALIGKQAEAAQFATVLDITTRLQPAWVTWLTRKPLQALALAPDWEQFLAIAAWCQEHPRPGIYLRQMDLPAVHTKFIEIHRAPLAELLDLVLAPEAIDRAETGAGRFASRYGFREKPERIRFRILDQSRMPTWPGDDITITAEAFAQLDPPVETVFMTENEINFLAFPPVDNSLIIFGSGYGFALLHQAHWLSRCRIHYWGDIDTHGFAILDQLRHHFEHVSSFLMDFATLMAFKHLWGMEATPTKRDLTMLTITEQALYNKLRDNQLGKNLRLEQERIGFSWLELAIREI